MQQQGASANTTTNPAILIWYNKSEIQRLSITFLGFSYICQMPATIQMGENDIQVHNPNAMATSKQE